MSSLIRRRRVVTVCTGLLLGGLCFSTGAYTQTPFPANYSIGAGINSNYAAYFTDVSSALATPGYVSVGPGCTIASGGGCGFASASLSPGSLDLSISGYSTSTNVFGVSSYAEAGAAVYYYVMGPGAAYRPVPMIYSGALSESTAGSAIVGSEVTVTTDSYPLSADGSSSVATTPFLFSSANGFYVYSSSASTATYNLNSVTVGANGQAFGAVGTTAGQFSAQIDPKLEIDPSWLTQHPGYSLVFSSNYAPVPLPAAAWLLLSGLGGIGFLRRRRNVP